MHLVKLITESNFLFYVGIISFIYILIKVVFKLYTGYVLYFTEPVVDCRRLGRWALVTGSTDGIGKGIARELAKLGINIILVSRNPKKLRRVAEEIENDFRVEVKCVTFDFATDYVVDDSSTVYDVIRDAIEELEIGILVNNVSMANKCENRFLNTFDTLERKGDLANDIANMTNCNVAGMAKMTELILPQMVKRGKGLIINMSSGSASFPCPTLALYAASKRFNDTFSRALSYEYEGKGVVIQSIQPLFVSTNMSELPPYGIVVPTYTLYSSHLMKTIGKERMCRGYWSHSLQAWLIGFLPDKIIAVIFLDDEMKTKNEMKVKDYEKKPM